MRCSRLRRRWWLAIVAGVALSSLSRVADAQVRGVYPTGMNATNAGVTPDSGFTYSNLFIFNARDESKGPDGEVVATGTNAVMIDLNTFVWVDRRTLLGGARLAKPHPFTEAGHREFNSFVWMPPKSTRAGEILLADSTVFSMLFGADDSLKQFWKNLVTAR
ncbi:MAG TPA: hypothetical protein VKE51_33980 [Vicinamibacterales bacterium]|nr:hypothetical protein [Vicinamibacterales bacterium]